MDIDESSDKSYQNQIRDALSKNAVRLLHHYLREYSHCYTCYGVLWCIALLTLAVLIPTRCASSISSGSGTRTATVRSLEMTIETYPSLPLTTDPDH